MEPLLIVADDPMVRCKMGGERILAEKNYLTFKRGLGEITGWDLVISQEICNIPGIIIRKTGEPVKVARFENRCQNGYGKLTGMIHNGR